MNEMIEVTPTVNLGTLQASTPVALLQSASAMATPLAELINKQKLFSVISGRKYVRVEGWTTLAVMMGVIPREASTTKEGEVYVSTVELVRMSDGLVLSRASAECGDEKPWCDRPLYARRSMAITRATGKACRIAFSWIMTLAGYEATPAEEMEPLQHQEETYYKTIRQNVSAVKQEIAEVKQTIGGNSPEAKDLAQLIADLGVDRNRVMAWLVLKFKVGTLSELTMDQWRETMNKLPLLAKKAAEPPKVYPDADAYRQKAREARERAEHSDDPQARADELEMALDMEARADEIVRTGRVAPILQDPVIQ